MRKYGNNLTKGVCPTMNKVYWSITGFSILVILFSFGYYISFNNAKVANPQSELNKAEVKNIGNDYNSNTVQAIDANKGAVIRTDSNTVYVEESYDIADAIYQDKEIAIPQEYIGLTRVEIQNKLQEYMRNPPQEEVKKGLVSVTLNSFSKASITVRKVYDNKEHYAYYLTEDGGYVVVYTNDKKTLVDQTGILISDLSLDQQKEVKNGVYLDDLEQLYGLLESYTS